MDIGRGERLAFVISPPRSGSTMLTRMLARHPRIYARPEPQLIAPLFQLGFYGRVHDPGQRDGTLAYHSELSAIAIKDLVADLPRGEDDYLDALRAYLVVIYSRLLGKSDRDLFVDKTPRNALYVDFIARLFPASRLLVLTRNPISIAWSIRKIFERANHPGIPAFSSPDTAALGELGAFTRAIGRLLREQRSTVCHVEYETLVEHPEQELRRVAAFFGVEYDPTMVEYGEGGARWQGAGDPTLVRERTRPTTEAIGRWAEAIDAEPGQAEFARAALACIADEDLRAWRQSRADLEAAIDASAKRH